MYKTQIIQAADPRPSSHPVSPIFTFSANRPNTRPPQELHASPKTFFAYCHLQILAAPRPIRTHAARRGQKILRLGATFTIPGAVQFQRSPQPPLARWVLSATRAAPHSEPRPSGLPLERSEGGRGHLSNAPAQTRRRATFRRFDFSIFRRFHQPPQHTTATAITSVPKRVCHLMSPSIVQDLRASNALAFTLGPFFRLGFPSRYGVAPSVSQRRVLPLKME